MGLKMLDSLTYIRLNHLYPSSDLFSSDCLRQILNVREAKSAAHNKLLTSDPFLLESSPSAVQFAIESSVMHKSTVVDKIPAQLFQANVNIKV